jgi:hypothetical protein
VTLPVFYWHHGDITLAIACSSRESAALAMNVDERDVFACDNPATVLRCNEEPGKVLTRNIDEGPMFYDYHARRHDRRPVRSNRSFP